MKIRIMHPNVGEMSFPLEWGDTIVLGRRGGVVDYEFNWDKRISRQHARLTMKNNQAWFEDLGSRNGSWHADLRLEGPICLDPGMTILVGETVICIPTVEEIEEESQWDDTTESGGDIFTVSEKTSDIRTEVETTPPKEPRRHARFTAARKVEVTTETRDELQQLWVRDISKGGLFVETNTPPSTGTKLEVGLNTPDGTLKLSSVVVHVIDETQAKAYGMAPGVGLQFVNMGERTKSAIRDYVDGIAKALLVETIQSEPEENPELDLAVEHARKFLSVVEQHDIYTALDVDPNTNSETMVRTIDEKRASFAKYVKPSSPPQAARLSAAVAVLERARRIMSRAEARLEHDFRKGHIRVGDRLDAAKSGRGPTLQALRRAWQRAVPDRVDRSAFMMKKAFAARQRRDFSEAINAGKVALELNPFFEELRSTIGAWEDLLQRGVSL